MHIVIDDLKSPEVRALIAEHIDSMHEQSPPESAHAMGADALTEPDITFWSMWEGKELLACGALKKLNAEHGEIKSMRTVIQHLRKGFSAKILAHIINESKSMGLKKLSLETGSMDSFIPARKLYEKFGFEYCKPFAGYVEDPYSVFMTRGLA